jgi:hypothetical protein
MPIVSNRISSRLVPTRFGTCALTAAAMLAFMATPAHAIFITYDVSVASYVALAQQAEYSPTVYLADNMSPVGGETAQFCSGVLISANVVLTAAHCVDDGATGSVTPAGTITTGFTADVPDTIPSGVGLAVVAVRRGMRRNKRPVTALWGGFDGCRSTDNLAGDNLAEVTKYG